MSDRTRPRKSAPVGGRPASPFPKRYAIRHDDARLAAWKVAAATCGIDLQSWIRATLDRESKVPHHVGRVRVIRTLEGVRRG